MVVAGRKECSDKTGDWLLFAGSNGIVKYICFTIFCSAEDRTQGFDDGRQALYH